MSWSDECVGYYRLQLPDKIETGIYPAERIVIEDGDTDSIFGEYHKLNYQGENIKGIYSGFYYNNYRIMVSEKKILILINTKRR
ncbi:hypothetical protein [Huaxiibacter chinensis]|uniref:hypothetical protein n=1 Tax=Huaxiibacter chinensis TaxID=2899785 RepID=UPI003D313B7B